MYLGQLFCNVSTHKHSFKVDPEILNSHPVFNDISGVGKILNPLLNLAFKWGVVPGKSDLTSACKPYIIPHTSDRLFGSCEVYEAIKWHFCGRTSPPQKTLRCILIKVQIWVSTVTYLLLIRDPKIIRLSSMLAMISDVLSPLSSSSPRVLKLANVKVLLSHSAITCFSFCSISRSFTALMQISCVIQTFVESLATEIAGELHHLWKYMLYYNMSINVSLNYHYKY